MLAVDRLTVCSVWDPNKSAFDEQTTFLDSIAVLYKPRLAMIISGLKPVGVIPLLNGFFMLCFPEEPLPRIFYSVQFMYRYKPPQRPANQTRN